MNKLHGAIVLSLALAFTAINTMAAVTKTKEINKRYIVTDKDVLVVNSQYGNVHIHTWKNKEVSAHVVVTATNSEADRATFLLEQVEIKTIAHEDGSHRIVIAGGIRRYNSGNGVNGGEISIDYTIYVPESMALSIDHSFGKVDIDDLAGRLKLLVTGGAFHLKKMTGGGNRITLHNSKGQSTIQYIKHGYAAGDGSLFIEEAGDMRIAGWDTLAIVKSESIDIQKSEGYVDIGSVKNITGMINKATVNIDALLSNADLKLSGCKHVYLGSVGSRDVGEIVLKADESDMEVHFDEHGAYYLDIAASGDDHTKDFPKYLGLVNSTAQNPNGYNNDHVTYKGKTGTKGGNIDMTVWNGQLRIK